MEPFLIEESRDFADEKARLTRMIEAIASLIETNEWQTLQELHFSQEETRIERMLLSEAKKTVLCTDDLYRLQGEYIWAKRYNDFRAWALYLKNQLKKLT